MNPINLQVNGKPLVFTGQSVSYEGYELYYSQMSNIAHRGGDQPAYVFDYNGKRMALPYDPKDKNITLKIFQQVVAMEKKRKEQSAPPEPPKEEPVVASEETDFSMFETSEPTVQSFVQQSPSNEKVVYVEKKKEKGFWSTGRLTIGIISMVLFLFISFQSCAAGFSNALEENNATSGSAGVLTSIMFLVAGIVGVCTRNSKGIVGAIIAAVLYFIGAIFTIGTGSTYGDLPIWGGLSAIFGVVYIVCAVKTKLNLKK